MWFNILKVLGTKSGFSQLDFDNIVIEDEDDCKTRFIEMCKKMEKLGKEIGRTLPEEIIDINSDREEMFIEFNKTKDLEGKDTFSSIRIDYDYADISRVPEEVVCKALELLGNGKRDDKVAFMGYAIRKWDYDNNNQYGRNRTTKRVWVDSDYSNTQYLTVGFVTRIRDKDDKYSKDLYNKLSEALK
tara:strand:+ start:11611 stop:12171 length:561 start_codon:yes stop_codon:yes gene_type:complete